MSTTARVMRGLGAVLLGSALLIGASAATATAATETAPQAETANTLPAPTLKKATIKGDNVVLIWQRVADPRVTSYLIYANGERLVTGWRTGGSQDSTILYLASLGLTGRETFTVVAESGTPQDGSLGETSPHSNGLVPVAPATLPAPVLTSATVERDSVGGATVTLTWTPSRSDEADITYLISVPFNGGPWIIASATNATTLTFQPDACGGACPLSGAEEYRVQATDRTLAESPRSNGLVPTPV